MFAKTAEDVQGKLVGGIFDRLFTPAAFFWLAGFVAWESGDVTRFSRLAAQLTNLTDLRLLVPSFAALAVIIFSSAAYEPLNGWLLRRLAGYWGPFDVAGEALRDKLRQRQRDDVATLQGLTQAPAPSAGERTRIIRLEENLRYLPGDPDDMLPTAFGCALVASDRRVTAKYGLSPQACWAALSYVLPDAARKDVAEATGAIEASGRLIFWTLASLVWIVVAPRPLAIAAIVAGVALVAGFAYVRLVQQARDYADAYEAAFDVGRAALYKTLRFPLPPNARDEHRYGEILTAYLHRGLDDSRIVFTGGS